MSGPAPGADRGEGGSLPKPTPEAIAETDELAKRKAIFIDIEAYHDLTVDEVWPDGDAPESFTADDVMALLTKDGLSTGLREWELLTGLHIRVCVYTKEGSTTAEATT